MGKKGGRPALSKKLKKINYGFTASPLLNAKLKKVKGPKSPFVGAVLAAVSEDFIKLYNADPEKFLSQVHSMHLSFAK